MIERQRLTSKEMWADIQLFYIKRLPDGREPFPYLGHRATIEIQPRLGFVAATDESGFPVFIALQASQDLKETEIEGCFEGEMVGVVSKTELMAIYRQLSGA